MVLFLFLSLLPVLLAILEVLRSYDIIVTKRNRRYHPIAGTVFQQFSNIRRLHDFHTDISRIHQTYRLYSPFRNHVYTVDPEVVEYILKTNFKNYGKGKYNYEIGKEFFGDGIFGVDGDKWRRQRKVASYEFSTQVLKNFSSNVFRDNAAKLAGLLSHLASPHSIIDIQDLFMKSAMDSIFKVGFGVELNTLLGDDHGTKFLQAFDQSRVLITNRYADALWKIKKFLNIGYEAKFKESIKILDEYIYKLIEEKKAQMSQQGDALVKKDDILSRFIAEMEHDPKNITPKYLRDVTVNFLIAGKDTTAGTLSWFIYLICKHPIIQDKLFQEVKEVVKVGQEDINMVCFARLVDNKALEKMKYLHAVLNETLRLYPTVAWDSKFCFSDDTLVDGFSLNKGDTVFYLPYAMGRMKKLWGTDAEEFKPERWIDKDRCLLLQSPYKFTAFQAGPRTCLGKDFAYQQMKIFAVVLLYFFEFKLSEESKNINYITMITLHIENGLHVHVCPR